MNTRQFLQILAVGIFWTIPLSCASGSKIPAELRTSGLSPMGTKGYIFFEEGKITDARALYTKAARQALQYDAVNDAALYLFNIGRCWFELDNTDSALACFSQARYYFSMLKNQQALRIASLYESIAWADAGNLDSARSCYQLAEQVLAESEKDRSLSSLARARVAMVENNDARAGEILSAAIVLELGEKTDMQVSAIADKKIIEACREKRIELAPRLFLWSARIAFKKNNAAEAELLLQKALTAQTGSSTRLDRSRILYGLSTVYACGGDAAQSAFYYTRAQSSLLEGTVLRPAPLLKNCGTGF